MTKHMRPSESKSWGPEPSQATVRRMSVSSWFSVLPTFHRTGSGGAWKVGADQDAVEAARE